MFLPQLLTYPNPKDPLNVRAAELLLRSPAEYRDTVREYVTLYASDTPQELPQSPSLEQSLSDLSEDET